MTTLVVPVAGLLGRTRQGWVVTWPLLVGSLSSLALAAADTAILGHYDTRALTAMAIASPLILATTAIITPVGSATQILTAQWAGAEQWDRLAGLLRSTIRVGLVLGIGALLLVAATSPWSLDWLGDDLTDSSGARSVLLLLLPTIPFTVVTAVGRGWLVGLGRTRASMHLAVAVNVANIALDLLLVFGADLGARGSAIGTSLAAGLGVVLMGWFVRKQRSSIPNTGGSTQAAVDAGAARLREIAWPDMVFGAIAYGSDVLVVAAVSRLDGVSLAAYRTIGTTVAIVFVIAYTVSNSLSMLVGQRLGADDGAGARRWTAPMALLMSVAVGVAGGGALLASDTWFSLLSSDAAVVEAAADQWWMWLMLLPSMVVSMMLAGIIRASGDTRSMMWIGLFAQGAFAMPLAWLLAIHFDWGLSGVVAALAAGWFLRTVLSIGRARFGSTWELPAAADAAAA